MKYTVRVKPGSSREKVEVSEAGEITLWVRAKPVDGKANDAVIRALADHWGVTKSSITICSGHTSKKKIVELGK